MEIIEENNLTRSISDTEEIFRNLMITGYSYKSDVSVAFNPKYFQTFSSSPLILKSQPSNLEMNKVDKILKKIGSESSEIKRLVENIISQLCDNLNNEVSIKSTDEDEVLIYWIENQTYYNILVDEDGEIELLYIPKDRTKSRNKFLGRNDHLTYKQILSAFNGMQ